MPVELGLRNRSGFRFWWPIILPLIVILVYGAFAGLAWWIQAGAHETGRQAMRAFPGDEVEALGALVQSGGHSFAERNRAVHALGQIGDRRALPVLEKFYTGRECEHDKSLCQKELRKAIDRCSGRNWAPRWLPLLPHAPG